MRNSIPACNPNSNVHVNMLTLESCLILWRGVFYFYFIEFFLFLIFVLFLFLIIFWIQSMMCESSPSLFCVVQEHSAHGPSGGGDQWRRGFNPQTNEPSAPSWFGPKTTDWNGQTHVHLFYRPCGLIELLPRRYVSIPSQHLICDYIQLHCILSALCWSSTELWEH